MSMMNRMHNSTNKHQGYYLKVLCVCSAGLLRSPTLAWVLGQEPWGFNTRAVGMDKSFALVPIDPVLLHWADRVVCVEEEHARLVRNMLVAHSTKPVHVVDIPDNYAYRDPYLVKLMTEAMHKLFPVDKALPDNADW